MSKFEVPVIKLPPFERHPKADRLFLTKIYDYPVIFNDENEYQEGDLVAYIPVDAVVPMTEEWSFLGDNPKDHRIRAKKLRGIFSMGLLVPAPPGSKEGDDVAEQLGIVKYEPPPQSHSDEWEKDPGFAPKYTNIQNYRRYPHVIPDGVEIIATEKLHGCNAMYCWAGGDGEFEPRLYARSHREYKKPNPDNLWWRAAAQNRLKEKLQQLPGLCIFGEVFGANVQDLLYGAEKNQHFFRAFDVFDPKQGKYLNYDEAKNLVTDVGIDWVPEIYRGPMNADYLKEVVEQSSRIADNLCEGVVIRTPIETTHDEIGRTILKLISRKYLLRKKGTEYH